MFRFSMDIILCTCLFARRFESRASSCIQNDTSRIPKRARFLGGVVAFKTGRHEFQNEFDFRDEESHSKRYVTNSKTISDSRSNSRIQNDTSPHGTISNGAFFLHFQNDETILPPFQSAPKCFENGVVHFRTAYLPGRFLTSNGGGG